MKTSTVEISNVLNAYIEKLINNPKRFSEYMEYLALSHKILTDRFGLNPDWSSIPIEEKCYHGWLRPYAFLSETVINGRWSYWHDIRATQEVAGKPIPQLHFYKPYDKEYKIVADMIKKCLKNLTIIIMTIIGLLQIL